MLAFHRRLVARAEVDADKLLYHGRSLGGGAACSYYADCTFKKVVFRDNEALISGGGLWVDRASVLAVDVRLTDNTDYDLNWTDYDGGVRSRDYAGLTSFLCTTSGNCE